MASITKEFLSGLTSGPMINVIATSSLTDIIHSCPSGPPVVIDEVTLYAVNNSTADVLLTLDIDNGESKFLLPGQVGLVKIAEKVLLDSTENIYAYVDSGTDVYITGYVNRITP